MVIYIVFSDISVHHAIVESRSNVGHGFAVEFVIEVNTQHAVNLLLSCNFKYFLPFICVFLLDFRCFFLFR